MLLNDPEVPGRFHNTLLVCLTLVIAAIAGLAAQSIHSPLPWMLGPLFAVALLRMAGRRCGRSRVVARPGSGPSAPPSASISRPRCSPC